MFCRKQHVSCCCCFFVFFLYSEQKITKPKKTNTTPNTRDKKSYLRSTAHKVNKINNKLINVSCDGIKSDPQFIQCGVHQESILGPLLFLLHFNDSAGILSHFHIVKYADDTVLYFSHKSVEVIERILNKDLATFTSWLETNELLINLKNGKTEYMLFGFGKRINKPNDPPMNIQYLGTQVNFTTTYKYVGITIKPTLNMSDHFTLIDKKASSRVNILKRIRYFINADTALNIYRSMIVPLLTYCKLVISHLNQTQRDKII